MSGVVPPQGEGLPLPFAELHEIFLRPFLLSVQVPPNGSTALWFVITSSYCVSFTNLVKVQSVPVI